MTPTTDANNYLFDCQYNGWMKGGVEIERTGITVRLARATRQLVIGGSSGGPSLPPSCGVLCLSACRRTNAPGKCIAMRERE
jgi:hypothetical protein